MQTKIVPFRRSQRVPERCAANDDVESITIIAGVSIEDREPDAIVSTTRAHYNREVGSMPELGGNFRHLLSPRLLHLAKHTVLAGNGCASARSSSWKSADDPHESVFQNTSIAEISPSGSTSPGNSMLFEDISLGKSTMMTTLLVLYIF